MLRLLSIRTAHIRSGEAMLNAGYVYKVTILDFMVQVNQAMSVKAETEWYRRWMGKLNGEGLGYTYGAM